MTPANVNSTSFGKYFSYALDGYVFAQPLYMSGLSIAGGTHNVVFVATEHDNVYALDADHNRTLWKASMLDTAHGAAAGATTVPSSDLGNSDIAVEVGITSTPVIDPVTNTLYVVAKSKESGAYLWRLHALDLATGAEKPNSPVVISGAVAGTGVGSVNGVIAFASKVQSNRESLLLLNGQVYFGYASYGDHGVNGVHDAYHGWVFAYDAATLKQTGIYTPTPKGDAGGVWEAGAGLAADTIVTSGRIFLATGNGSLDAKPPFTNGQDYGDSVIRLTLNNGAMQVSDDWTPFDQAHLNSGDLDQGSGGVLVLPDQPGSHVHELIQAGKNGRIEVLDRENLGGYNTTSNNIVQEISGQIGKLWGTPAYWNGNVYFGGSGAQMKQYTLSNGRLSTSPVASSTSSFGFPGPSPVISSSGASNGIMWAIRADAFATKGPAILYAFDATNISHQLYSTTQDSARDFAGPAVKFTVPLVADGKVFVGTQGEVDVYGLLANAPATAAAPTFSPAPGKYAATQNVTLSSATSGATIYYTTSGSAPTTASSRYQGPIAIGANTTLRAIAVAPGLETSSLCRGTYTIGAAAPTFSPSPGTYASAQNVSLSDTASGAAIYYTTNGSTPTTASTKYVGPIAVNVTTTIKAIAAAPGANNSSTSSGTYTIGSSPGTAAAPSFTPPPGTFASAQNVSLSDTTSGATIYYTTNGSTPTTASTKYVGPIPVNATTTIKAIAAATGLSNSSVSSGTYTIGSASGGTAAPTFTPTPGSYVSAQSVSLADATNGATLYYTTDGSIPTASSTPYAGPIAVSATTTIQAFAASPGLNDSPVSGGTYTIGVAPTIDFSNGFAGATGLTLNGSATDTGDTRLHLTTGQLNQAGSAFWSTPVNIQSFSTDFQFQITGSGQLADGMTFAMQADSAKALGPGGSGLGYGASQPGHAGGLPKSAAVKFDLYSNAGEGFDSTGLYLNGASPTIPAIDLSQTGIKLTNQHSFAVHINYDGATLSLTIRDLVTNAAYSHSFSVNLPQTIGSSTAYVGFTGGTGGLSSDQKILNWTFTQ